MTILSCDPLVEVALESSSQIVNRNGSRVWCARYPGLAGLFRKDRGPSKELGRALCDEVKERFSCEGFLTTDELPGYGISRQSRRAILAAVGAGPADCVVVYAYQQTAALAIDEYLHGRLHAMLQVGAEDFDATPMGPERASTRRRCCVERPGNR